MRHTIKGKTIFIFCTVLAVVADALAHASKGPLQLVDLAGQDGLAQVEHWCSGAYDAQAKHRDGLQALFNKEAGSSAAGPQLQQLDQRLAALRSSLVQQRAALDATQWSARAHVADTELAVQDGSKDLKALRAVATRLTDAGMKAAGGALSQLMSQADLQQGRDEEDIRKAQKVLKETTSQAQAIAQIEGQYNNTRLIKEKLMSRQLSAQKSQGALSSALAAANDYLNNIQDICNKGKQVRGEMESTVLPALRQVAAKSPPPEAATSVPQPSNTQTVPSMTAMDAQSVLPMTRGDADVSSPQPAHKVASLAVLSKPSVRSSAVFGRLTAGLDDDDDDSPSLNRAPVGKAKTTKAHLNDKDEDSAAPKKMKFQMESDWDNDDDGPSKKQSSKSSSPGGAASRLNADWDDDDDVPLKKQSSGRKPASRLLQGMDEPDILPPEHSNQQTTTTTAAKTTTTTTTPIAAVARLQAAFDSDSPDNVTIPSIPDPSPSITMNSKKAASDATTTISAIEAAIYAAATSTTTTAASPFSFATATATAPTSALAPASASSFNFDVDTTSFNPLGWRDATTTTTTTQASTTAGFTAEGSSAATAASFDEVAQDFDDFDGESLMEVGSNVGKSSLRRSGTKDAPTISGIVLGGYSDVLKNKALQQLADNNPSLEKLQGLEDHLGKSNPATSDSSPQAQTNRWCMQQGSAGLSGPVNGALSALDAAEISLAESKATKKAVGLEVKTLKKVQEAVQQDVQGLSALQAWVQQEETSLNSRLEAWQSQAPQDESAISSAAKVSTTAHSALIDAISKALSQRNSAFQAQQGTLSHATSEEANAKQLLSQAAERRTQAAAAVDQARKNYKSAQASCDNAHVAMELKKRHMKMKLRAMSVAITALNAK